jgi:hypothetical protein
VAWVLAFVLPVVVAVSRLYRGMHHLTDVLASVVLGIGAVVGRDFSWPLVGLQSDAAQKDGIRILEPAIDAHMIAGAPELPGRYRFSHALVRDVVYHSLTPSRRAELHTRVGEFLESRGFSDPRRIARADDRRHDVNSLGYAREPER